MSAGSSLSGSHPLSASSADKRSAGFTSSLDGPGVCGAPLTPSHPEQRVYFVLQLQPRLGFLALNHSPVKDIRNCSFIQHSP